MTVNEQLREFYVSQLGINTGTNLDLEAAFLRQATGQTGPSPQLMDKYLRGLGYTGTVSDMLDRWLPTVLGKEVPGQFLFADWSIADLANGGGARITISTLPNDGGSPITALQYSADGGPWTSLGGTTTGTYDIGGLQVGVTIGVQVRAVNFIGTGLASTNKAVTPTNPNPNLLVGLSWTAGANTTLSIANGFARATRNGANPRIYKHAVDLFQIGATYQLGPSGIYLRNSTNVVFRVSDTAAIGTDGPFDTALLTANAVVDATFVADATSYYFGLVGVNTLNGHYVECDEDFSVTYVSGP